MMLWYLVLVEWLLALNMACSHIIRCASSFEFFYFRTVALFDGSGRFRKPIKNPPASYIYAPPEAVQRLLENRSMQARVAISSLGAYAAWHFVLS